MSISVIIPLYNRRDLVVRAVDSVLNQDYRDFELIVVDDGSDDDAGIVIGNYNDERIRYVRQKNQGVSSARNYGVKLSRYDYIAFLDSDDEWLPGKLTQQVKSLSDGLYRICYTGEKWVRNGREFYHKKSQKKFSGEVFRKCLNDCFIGCSTVLMEKSLFWEVDGFDKNLLVCEDYDLWLKISCKYPVMLIDEPFIKKYGGHKDQLSTKMWGNDRFRLRSIYSLLQSGKLNSTQMSEAKRVFTKKCVIVAGGCLKRGRYKDFAYYLSLLKTKPMLGI